MGKDNLDTEKQKENKNLVVGHTEQVSLNLMGDKLQQDAPPGEEFVSFGEKIHDGIVTWGVDYTANSAFGVAATYGLERTKIGQEWIGKPLVNGMKKLLSPVLKSAGARQSGAQWAVRFLSIMVGGTVIIPFMTLLENGETKTRIIRWWDECRYGKETVENDPKFAEAYRRIEAEPHKDFTTGMAARFIAIAPLITAATFMPNLLTKQVYDRVGNSLKWLEHKLLRKKGGIQWLDNAVDTSKLPNGDYLHRIIGFDFGLTPAYALLHKVSFDYLAGWRAKKHTKNNDSNESTPVALSPGAQPEMQKENSAECHACRIRPQEKPAKTPPARYTQKIADSGEMQPGL